MVVCKCRKVLEIAPSGEQSLIEKDEFLRDLVLVQRAATKLYCFVHKVPVCGECICFLEHQICMVDTYSQWVIDGDFDWPPKCCHCQAVLADGTDQQITRLGCLHVIHSNCLVSHVKSFPPHTAPAGYVCPACSTTIWPPKSVKDSGSRLHSKLREAIGQTGLEKNLFGNYPVPKGGVESHSSSPPFTSETRSQDAGHDASSTTRPENLDIIVEINGLSSGSSPLPNHEARLLKSPSPSFLSDQPGATTRKSAMQERQNSEISYYADDEDWNGKKYSRRGSFRHKFLRSLLPFWSNPPPGLPVVAPPRRDASHGEDASEGRPRHHRTRRIDPRKLLLVIAIIACLATMGILYYRIAQRGLGEEVFDDVQQLQP